MDYFDDVFHTFLGLDSVIYLAVNIVYSRAVKMAEKLNSNFVPKYYQNSNYIRI